MEYSKDNRLCPDHKEAFGLKGAETAKRTEDLAEDEEIDCDACAMSQLRKLGMV
jgi:hypothetical protein